MPFDWTGQALRVSAQESGQNTTGFARFVTVTLGKPLMSVTLVKLHSVKKVSTKPFFRVLFVGHSETLGKV
jgi:hypothetical protein